MAKPNPRVVKLADLVPDSRNANKGTLRGLAMLDDSLREDGAGRGILLDRNNNIIAGNKTIERAVDAGFEEIIVVPTDGKQLVATQRVDVDLDSPQGRRMGLRDNRVAQVDLEFDPDVLKGLQDDGVDLSALWDADELTELLASVDGGTPATDPGAQIDRAEELQAKWQVLVGETWRIPSKTAKGDHRLVCGDCTDRAVVERVMRGERADCVIADPPYGMNLDASYHNSQGTYDRGIKKSKGYSPVIGDNQEFDPRPCFELFGAASEQFWFGADYYRQHLPEGGSWLVWDKRDGLPDFDYSLSEFELCWSKVSHARKVYGVRWFGAFGTESQDTKQRIHPTQKPTQLIKALIELSKGDTVLDPFLGSGTTLVACEQTGRLGRGVEIEPKYCAVILERLAGLGLSSERVA